MTPSILLQHVSKHYSLYASPRDRLKEALHPLRKKYHTIFKALDDISFEVPKGQTLGILGVNGAGKSTLLKIITGVTQPTSGEVTVNGKVTALLELGAGFNPELSGAENIFFAGMLQGFSREAMQEKYDEIANFADIGDYLPQPMKHYSSGMFARLAFALNTCVEPDIFIVDEALAVGDAAFVQRCMRRFHQMQDSGTTILFVTHDSSAVKQVCQEGLWLHEGRMRVKGPASKVSDAYLRFIHDIQLNEPDRSDPSDERHGVYPKQTEILPSDIPIIQAYDGRNGDQAMLIQRCGLFTIADQPVVSIEGGQQYKIRMQVTNIAGPEEASIGIGYVIRNRLGVDLASNSNRIEGTDLGSLRQGYCSLVEVLVDFPSFYPGTYSLTPRLSYRQNGNNQLADSPENSVMFEITSQKTVYVIMTLPTKYNRVR